MRNGKGKRIMRITTILLSALALLSGCHSKPPLAPVTGGVTDKSDRKAPKVIESKDISDYSAHFMLRGEWSPGHESVFYTFEVKPDGSGTLTASESVTGVSAPADKSLLDALQAVIDECRLAGENGVYRITAGLDPSEFGPCTLTAHYASGEQLTFTVNNEPSAEWAKKTYLAFADWFATRGIDALTPPAAAVGTVTNVSLTFKDAETGIVNDYGVWSEPDAEGRRVFFRFLDGEKTEAALADEKAFFAGVNEILTHYDLRPYDVHSVLYGCERTEEDGQDPFSEDFELTFWFEDGSQMSVGGVMPLVKELRAYFDAQFPEV